MSPEKLVELVYLHRQTHGITSAMSTWGGVADKVLANLEKANAKIAEYEASRVQPGGDVEAEQSVIDALNNEIAQWQEVVAVTDSKLANLEAEKVALDMSEAKYQELKRKIEKRAEYAQSMIDEINVRLSDV